MTNSIHFILYVNLIILINQPNNIIFIRDKRKYFYYFGKYLTFFSQKNFHYAFDMKLISQWHLILLIN